MYKPLDVVENDDHCCPPAEIFEMAYDATSDGPDGHTE